jgi:hypothetical protein
MAVWALVSALVGLFPVGITLGVLALRRTRSRGTRGRGLAIAALAVGSAEVVAAIAVALIAATVLRSLPAELSEPRQAHARQLVVGNCLAELPTDGVVDLVQAVPCGQVHAAQVTSTYTFTDGGWPGQVAADRAVADSCRLTDEQTRAGAWLVAWAPTRSSWNLGDRTGLCLVVGG